MRTCVIFNPTARGNKASRFRQHLDEIARECTLMRTTCAGDARRLAREAVQAGFEIVVAAGGDGTLNEVLNGIGDAPEGFQKACLGVLPLGTVNVFARELAIPSRLEAAWQIIQNKKETQIDLPWVDFIRAQSAPCEPGTSPAGERERRYFAQLAGAGLDARAIELVKWEVKKKIGPLAYVLAGLHAVLGPPSVIEARGPKQVETGGLVLIGNGRLYGGQFRLFPGADLRDGTFDVCVFPRVSWLTLAQCGPSLLLRGTVPSSTTRVFSADTLTLSSSTPTPLQIDGELIGKLPATLGIQRLGLRLIAP